ncbi:U3 small nucleolar RNA-associated protein 15 homolog [Callorhinchus milii]|uniref:U3 small nucleolar RNA-associated protein 15 homolog n=1 Tax=Callorhinchus milii TaxID=7868 RepID=V9KPN7_CALMI|nr:U3 small nucleolar RNA-associated protein 15 homolog [Callorhinchus milii]XP_042190626.1 U3 small nucleolar RNA-associated protein 15 homolog [Callorhinchus milii]|eukprot:gi/632963648/ref/XP_007897998.1/ PREDICTED: U3 small nucleolar RNA-associated protein 15 homolog [Callorhinchus milii]
MASYKPTAIQSCPKPGKKITQDTVYWKSYKTPIQIKEFGAVTKVDFSPIAPYNYAVTASARVHIYGRYSQEPIKTFSRFKDTAYCGTYREDGKLLVAGSEDGVVRLFDLGGRAALRDYRGHTKGVHVTAFTSDKYRLMSGSDDYSVKLWDIPTSTEIFTLTEHTDYIRCGCTSNLNADLFVTGSYDHTVKVFDARADSCVMTMEHGQPVESVLLFPSGGLLVSAGGQFVKVWDMLKGGQLLVSLRNHHKTVTCLCLNSSGQRLLSGSLDRHVKIYSTSTYKVVHSLDYTAAILSLALAPEDEAIVVGMTNSVLSVRHRKQNEKKPKATIKRKGPSYRYFIKGKDYMPKKDDLLVSRPMKLRLKKYDELLKSFQVSRALDAVLETNIRVKTPEITVGIMQELNRRGTLANALAGRNEQQLSLLLSFLIRHIVDPRFTPILINVAEIIIDIYRSVVGESSVVDNQFLRLQDLIGREIDYQEELLEVLGMMDTLFATITAKKEAVVLGNQNCAIAIGNKMEESMVVA